MDFRIYSPPLATALGNLILNNVAEGNVFVSIEKMEEKLPTHVSRKQHNSTASKVRHICTIHDQTKLSVQPIHVILSSITIKMTISITITIATYLTDNVSNFSTKRPSFKTLFAWTKKFKNAGIP